MDIRDYLLRRAHEITSRSGTRADSADELERGKEAMRTRFLEMMGLDGKDHLQDPPSYRCTGELTIDGGRTRVENIFYESLPCLYVTANLYIPLSDHPLPAVVYMCGHAPDQKWYYQYHAVDFARRGFVCMVIEGIQLGEIPGFHHGTYRFGWFNWISRGYTPAGVETLNAIRAVDLLCTRPEVDPKRIGATGNSGGGAYTWFLAAADERIAAAASSCGTGTLYSHLKDRTLDGHCDCMFLVNYHGWDLADLAALIAPRPFLIASTAGDVLFTIESIREAYAHALRPFELLGVPENIRLVEAPGKHGYHPVTRRAIAAWFLRHLQGKDVSPEEVDDADTSNVFSKESLRVFTSGIPADERNTTVQDWFVEKAKPPHIETVDELETERRRVTDRIKRYCMGGLMEAADAPLNVETESTFEMVTKEGETAGVRFSFDVEFPLRRAGAVAVRAAEAGETPLPALVVLGPQGNPPLLKGMLNVHGGLAEDSWYDSKEGTPEGEVARHPSAWPSPWRPDRQRWFVRRAGMVTGRTLAAIRIFDAIRLLRAVRELPQCDGRVVLYGRGEWAMTAVYAALLDGGVKSVVLEDVPPTHDLTSSPDGEGAVLELPGVLRWTDIPTSTGLLYPAEVVFVGGRPAAFSWAEELYTRLGPPGRTTRVRTLEQWRPEYVTASGTVMPAGRWNPDAE